MPPNVPLKRANFVYALQFRKLGLWTTIAIEKGAVPLAADILDVLSFLCLCVVLGLELSPFFMMGVFEIGSLRLFTWAGFEPQSS
jgi:hypothetical protein